MRKIAVVTGSRAEYGLLYWIIKAIHEDPALELQLIVTGMHLSRHFGMTVRQIEQDGFPIAEKVKILSSSDSPAAITDSMGRALSGFGKSYERLRPDILVVLGDRFEAFCAVAAAAPFRIPVAHIHGGESTEGAMDELFRHAMTKMSHLHFAATGPYGRRIIRMGEPQDRVFSFGSPAVDNCLKIDLMEKDELLRSLGVRKAGEIGVMTYHPVTLGTGSAEGEVNEILHALLSFPHLFWVITFPNADPGGRAISGRLEDFVTSHPGVGKLFHSLGQRVYLSLLRHARVMVGNSSSGLIEAPYFRLPVVNIGDRQKGRVRAKNVLDVTRCERREIARAINRALGKGFRDSLSHLKNPYGDQAVSERIVATLRRVRLDEKLLRKPFSSAAGKGEA
jgi:UDP-hydrolysing UDP-N-acetyl-D-glucosamine 2-epimerase